MSEKSRNVWVGMTAIIAVAGFCLMLMLFGYVPNLVSPGYNVKVEFANASGLNIGSLVKLSGMVVGRVSDIKLAEPPKRGVVVTMQINKDIRLVQGVRVAVEAQIMGGTPSIGLDDPELPPGQAVSYLPTDGSAYLQGESTSIAGQLAGQLQSAMQEPMKKFEKLGTQFDKLSSEWVKVGQNLNMLLEPRTPEAVDAGKAEGNAATLIVRADKAVKDMHGVLEGMDKWINDPELLSNIKTTAANAANITGKLSGTLDKYSEMADGSKKSIEALAKRYIAVADDLSGAVLSLQKTIEQARAGEGTVGKLVNDPALYNNLNDAVQRMNTAMKEAQLLLEKWKAEGLPVHF